MHRAHAVQDPAAPARTSPGGRPADGPTGRADLGGDGRGDGRGDLLDRAVHALRTAWLTRTTWGRPWAARVVAALGLVSVVSAAFPPLRGRVSLVLEVLPRFAPATAAGATAAVGVLLVALSSGLRRGKRRAWQVATAASAAAASLHLVKGLDVEEAALSLAVLALLLVTREAFPGRPDPRSTRHTVAVLVGSLAAATAIGAAPILLDPDESRTPLTPGSVLAQVWRGMVGLGGPLTFRRPGFDHRVGVTLLLLGVLVAALTLAAALRPAGGPHRLTPDEQERLRGLVDRFGEQDSLAYFALRDEKSVIFSPSGKAAVAYAVVGGVSLASGDPLGDPEAWPQAISAWLDEARRYAWAPAVLAASERAAETYGRAGLDALELGDEAIVDVSRFTLDGRPMRGVRQSVTRLRRKGYEVEVARVADLAPDRVAGLADLADRWRDGPVERGFSMALGRFGDPRDAGTVVVVARDADGAPQGLLGFVPWGRGGLSLDLMRRDRLADNGVMELMVVALVEAAPDLGLDRVSLNFAVFRSAFERGSRIGAGPVLRLWHRVLLGASRFWQIESLYRANAKYRPDWEPRYVCFARAAELPRIAAAALEAESFVTRPRWVRRVLG